jgi:hypothetical protein
MEVLNDPFVKNPERLPTTDLGADFVAKVKQLQARKPFTNMLKGMEDKGRALKAAVLALNGLSLGSLSALVDKTFIQVRHAFNELCEAHAHKKQTLKITRDELKAILEKCSLGALASDAVMDIFDPKGAGEVAYCDFMMALAAFRGGGGLDLGEAGKSARLFFDIVRACACLCVCVDLGV